ncbi:MAG: lipid-A-disaccharide [Beijerinckiaceae bacterium]|nr:MAG: lipid-A-disaccharide [Beijerinckiaceae bacterium]
MRPLRIAVVAGEASGDLLGASLLRALSARGVSYEAIGVGGDVLLAEGLKSFFEASDIAVMGLGPVIRKLPLLIRRIRETAQAIVAAKPDILVTIDAPDFCKRVAKRVRAAAPDIPIVHWVCPSVWAWRPGRAPAMRPYIDHVLCLLPFEPKALAELKGPPGTYVGHPLVEQMVAMRPQTTEEAATRASLTRQTVLLLPGSRLSELRRLLPLILDAKDIARPDGDTIRWVIPTLPRLVDTIRAGLGDEADAIEIIADPAEKQAAMRVARAALAASGTVTLELALAGIPMVTTYKVANWEAAIARRLIRVSSAILPNLILGENIVPEFIQQDATAENLGAALRKLLIDSPEVERQRAAFERLAVIMRTDGASPSEKAAALVLDLAQKGRDRLAHDKPAARP